MSGAAGFSLVELLTAMAITSLMMFALLSLVGQSSTNYRISQRKVSAIADSRALFHFLENDLSSRVGNTKFFLRTNPANHSEFAFIRTRDAQDSNATGDLATCVYYVAYSNDDANSGSPKLFRRTLDGPSTQRLLEQGNAATFPATDPTMDDPIAYNIARFEVRPLRRAAVGAGSRGWTPPRPLRKSSKSRSTSPMTFPPSASAKKRSGWPSPIPPTPNAAKRCAVTPIASL